MVITSELDVKPSGESSVGSSQMLKLFEISKVFEGEAKLLKIVYILKVHCGLSCSIQNETHGRDWYKDARKTYIAWKGRRQQGSK